MSQILQTYYGPEVRTSVTYVMTNNIVTVTGVQFLLLGFLVCFFFFWGGGVFKHPTDGIISQLSSFKLCRRYVLSFI